MNRPANATLASVAAVVLAGGVFCGSHALAQSQPAIPLTADATDPPAPFATFLRAIPSATTVRIRNGWMGLSPLAPVDDRYEFHRVGDVFQASAVCHAARHEHRLPDVTFRASTLTTILARFAHVSVSSGPFRPLIMHTDDYPSTTIEFDTPAGTVSFTSQSQGRFAPPWQIALPSAATGVVSASVPGEAVSALLAGVGANLCSEWLRTLPMH